MMRMVDLSSQRGPPGTLRIIDTATAVDCSHQARFRRSSFRALVECFFPSCCALSHHHPSTSDDYDDASSSSSSTSFSSSSTIEEVSSGSPTTSVVTGTFFGNRRGRVSFCLQDDSRSSTMLLLLEFGVPTAYLAREMQCGSLRITLKCEPRSNASQSSHSERLPLYGVPLWSMYCNGRKVGYAVRRQPSATDMLLLKLMRSVSAGAGVLPVSPSTIDSSKCEGGGEKQFMMYLRASFQRVVGSTDSEAFHIINPVGSSAQELSMFLLRSSS